MSEAKILHFPHHNRRFDNDPHAADSARQRIASLPDQYSSHAMPSQDLAHKIPATSPAAEHQSLRAEMPSLDEFALRKQKQTAKELPGAPKTKIKAATAPSQPKANGGPTKLLPSKAKPIITALVTFAIIFMIFKAPIFLTQLSYATQKPANTPAQDANAPVAVGPDSVIDIPKINVHAPLVFAKSNIEASIQKDLEGGVVHYAQTAVPGTVGNSVIFGHSSNDWWEPGNYKFVFVLLDKLVVGDTFTINHGSKQYLYQVSEVKIVEPTDLSVLEQTPEAQVTLITCSPPGTSWKRLIVRAKQLTPVAKTSVSVQSNGQKPSILPSNAPGIIDGIGNLFNSVVNFFNPADSKSP